MSRVTEYLKWTRVQAKIASYTEARVLVRSPTQGYEDTSRRFQKSLQKSSQVVVDQTSASASKPTPSDPVYLAPPETLSNFC